MAFLGCKQGAGDRCQRNEDCDDGLCCLYSGTPDVAHGALCQPGTVAAGQCIPSMVQPDASIIPDASMIDATTVDATDLDATTD
jgi:hypothetical protein